VSEVSRLEDVRTNHETSIQYLQDSHVRSSEEHECKRDEAAQTIHALSSELRTTKQALDDVSKRERQVMTSVSILTDVFLVNLDQLIASELSSALSPGRSPRGQGPGKNNWTDRGPSGLPDKNFWHFGIKNRKRPDGNPVFHGGWSRRLSHTHSY